MKNRNCIMRFITWSMYNWNKAYGILPDKQFLELKYWATFGKKLRLENPKRYTEKLQWLKLYDRKPIYTTMVDKSLVKEYVQHIIGEEYIIPTLGIWDNFDEIDFSLLPERFVLKCTHDSGGLVICRNKSDFDIEKARKKINNSLKTNYYLTAREWPYKNVKPRIIAEEYIEDSRNGDLNDYKFFAFDGEVKALFVASDRQNITEETKFNFFDENYTALDIINGHPMAEDLPKKPIKFEQMKFLAEKLSVGIPHVRVDFYEVDEKIYFGELTFSHWSGFVPFEPEEWDEIFGSWIKLPKNNDKRKKNE